MIDWSKNVLAPCQDVFGEPMVFYPAKGQSFPFSGIFDNAFKEFPMSEYGTEVATTYPAVGVNLAEFPKPPLQGDQLKRQSTGKIYVVREPRSDSHGSALLILNYVRG